VNNKKKITVQEFCEQLRRDSVKFEHNVVCINKKDLLVHSTQEEWWEIYLKWAELGAHNV
jgi:hypothetical protein